MMERICVLGSGSAGLIAALTLKKKFPACGVRVVRSPEIGVIGVGEGTTNAVPRLLFDVLGLSQPDFYAMVEPTWKMGLRMLWGPRKEFYYTFSREYIARIQGLSEPAGAWCLEEEDISDMGPISAAMAAGRCLPRTQNGLPDLRAPYAFHLENRKFVAWLEKVSLAAGVTITDGTMQDVQSAGDTVQALVLASGETVAADLFIDASGFRAELLGRHLGVPWRDFSDALFCDRALIGGWDRAAEEPVSPFTTVETMDAGWCWKIEHEHYVNRGYVYGSRFVSDDAALAEYRTKNPKAADAPRVVKFRTGCLEKAWVGNVVAVGNAVGFVEPLEASALQVLSQQCANLVGLLEVCDGVPNDSVRQVHNRSHEMKWNGVRDFLACHYAFNTRLDTPFWKHCRAETPLGGAADFVQFYQDNGIVPDVAQVTLDPVNAFGAEGHLAMLIGQRVPVKRRYRYPGAERTAWHAARRHYRQQAAQWMTVPEALAAVRKQGSGK